MIVFVLVQQKLVTHQPYRSNSEDSDSVSNLCSSIDKHGGISVIETMEVSDSFDPSSNF